MRIVKRDGNEYRLPNTLNEFQEKMYIHLIDWKWSLGIEAPGTSRGGLYDAILPDDMIDRKEWPHIYPSARELLKSHRTKNPFRIHQFFYHVVSSQAANINLFLPILHHPEANKVLGVVKADFAVLATDCLDNGYCLEYWGGNCDHASSGLLGDKSGTGTDTDIAIAYRNHQGELCLWLIEHKLTEKEFTECGGADSEGKKPRHDCSKSFSDILSNKNLCYYHDECGYRYWDITDTNRTFFANSSEHKSCPFRGGMNQLWRNQLLGLALEKDSRQPYKHVTFSVVRHPENTYLDDSINTYEKLIGHNSKFSTLTSAKIVDAAARVGDAKLDEWVKWYREVYAL